MVRNYILDHKSLKGFKLPRKGAFAQVTRAAYRDRCVAVKRYNEGVPSEIVEREIAIMQAMRHERHVIHYLGHFNDVNGIAHVVMDFAYNLSLFQLRNTVGKLMSRSIKNRIARDICRGLHAFHKKGMVHEDIKSENIVLDFGLRARLCDFGSSRRVDEPPVKESGTSGFRAPERQEYIDGKRDGYDPMKSDIYSLGVVLSSFLGRDNSIAVRCSCRDPNERPTSAQVLEQLGEDERVPYDHFSGFFPLQLTEAEKLNLAYCWTGFKVREKPGSLSHVRELMFRGDYKQAKEKLAEIDDQRPTLQLLGAIADFYISRDGDSREQSMSILEGIKRDFEEGSLERLTADYFGAAYTLEVDEREGAKMLYRLSMNGNALAQAELSKFYGCRRRVPVEILPSRIGETAIFMCTAASSGLANAQSMLTILYLLQHGSTSVPLSVKVSLDMGVEGGSPIGQIFKDVAENRVYEIFAANPDLYKNVALVQLCGDICRILKRTELSKKWYTTAAEAGCADAAHCLAVMALKEGDYSAAEGWCKKAMQLIPTPKRSGKRKVEDMFLQDLKFFLITSEYLVVAALVLQGRMAEAIETVKASTDYSDDGIMSLFRIERVCSTVGGENSNVWYELLCEKSGHADSAETLSSIAESYMMNSKSYTLNFVEFVTPPPDPTKSFHFSSKGAERGHHHSICRLADLLYNRGGEVDRGIALLQQASQEGYAEASFALSGHFSSIGDPEKSMEYLELASAQGDPRCILGLASKLVESQPKRAKQLMKQCVEEGYLLNACRLLSILESNKGNRSRSIYWIERALSLVAPYSMHGDEFFYNSRQFMKWQYVHRNELAGDSLLVLSIYESCISGYCNLPRKMLEFLCLAVEKGSILAREPYESLLSLLHSRSHCEMNDVFLIDLSAYGQEFHPYGLECSRCALQFENGDRGWRCFQCGYYELCKGCWAQNAGCSDHKDGGFWELFDYHKRGEKDNNVWASSTVVDTWQDQSDSLICICDGCNTRLDSVTGRRKCILCANYDLCQNCFGKCREIHPEHIFWYPMGVRRTKRCGGKLPYDGEGPKFPLLLR